MTLTPATLLGSNREKPCVQQVFGISGTGKTVFLCETIRQAARSQDFGPKHRFIIFDVKHEGYESLAPPKPSTSEALKTVDKDKVLVIHPEMDSALQELNSLINFLFESAKFDKDFSATLILEESSTFIGSSVGSIPPTLKRFATQGRSLGLSLLLVNQRALSNKWTDTQSSSITCFRLARPDARMLHDRWGLNAEEMDEKLGEKKFSFAHFDLESLSLDYYDPIEIPNLRIPIVMPKKRRKISDLLKRPFI
jgi:hypothetical protein|tara:strand:- start:1531 stop:2286 length:756 start_codon:yes stop_codon:yes gene_type:complete